MTGVIWRSKAFLVEQTTSTVSSDESLLIKDSSRSIANLKSAIVLFIYGCVTGGRVHRSPVFRCLIVEMSGVAFLALMDPQGTCVDCLIKVSAWSISRHVVVAAFDVRDATRDATL